MIRSRGVNKTRWLHAVHYLGHSAMQEHILDVELMNGPRAGESQTKYHTIGGRLHNWTQSLVVVNLGLLSETT